METEKGRNSTSILITVFLLCVSADGARQVPYTINTNNGRLLSSSDSDVGFCKSMVETQGYSCEEHTVTTTDGYILSLQRIPARRTGVTADKPPVLLQHGLLVDAANWLLNTPEQSLGFILADNGYDVWLANTRGTKYSSGHTSLSPSDPAYWDWSWDELAAYDLPASVQYVHDQTGQNLHYVGHSLGTLMALAAFSQQQSLNMIRSAALLSPIAYLDQITTLLGKAAAYSMIGDVLYWSGVHEFIPGGETVTKFINGICLTTNIDCSSITSAIAGPPCCISPSTMDAVFKYGPQPTATKNMLHLAQMVRQGTIAMHDYRSEDDNKKHYRQPKPPVYNMSSIPNDLPLFLAHGGQDYLSDPVDVQTLMGALSDHDADKLVVLYLEEYAHLDFTLAGNANQVVYDPIMGFFSLN
ncbi:triacylglycerol lipase 2-like isoform X2 [Rhododendron vialii]|uniref:triacylglycerol lipase 2-like isoform X2 n=1 Tax=Rhododendron vialii TaxID=182163 RepID=UPI00265DCFA3|nr:triacylglycerol lipase 2-like isoform X2 [Rhododendron vialii]